MEYQVLNTLMQVWTLDYYKDAAVLLSKLRKNMTRLLSLKKAEMPDRDVLSIMLDIPENVTKKLQSVFAAGTEFGIELKEKSLRIFVIGVSET